MGEEPKAVIAIAQGFLRSTNTNRHKRSLFLRTNTQTKRICSPNRQIRGACGDEAMMLHNGVDPTQTEGMSKGVHRSEGEWKCPTCTISVQVEFFLNSRLAEESSYTNDSLGIPRKQACAEWALAPKAALTSKVCSVTATLCPPFQHL